VTTQDAREAHYRQQARNHAHLMRLTDRSEDSVEGREAELRWLERELRETRAELARLKRELAASEQTQEPTEAPFS
jgi:hypothetical protein